MMVILHQHLDGCDKHPGHVRFIPVDRFNVDHLPPGYHDNDLVEFIRAMSDLTVRVSVKYTSEWRPDNYEDYMMRGHRDFMRLGTGCVCRVKKYPDEYSNNGICECMECLSSPTPKTQFARIYIFTGVHVFFDNIEAAHTTCHLFFDKGGRPDVCDNVVTLGGMSCVARDIQTDWCMIKCVTHDLDLADKLYTLTSQKDVLHDRIRDKYRYLWYGKKEGQFSINHARLEQHLTIIVSHPHGCSKQVSVGHWFNRNYKNGKTMDTYTTATCSGSAGAYVFVLGRYWDWLYNNHVHRGIFEENGQLNYGSWEAEVNSGEEVDLHQDVDCEKNPGHPGFIPVDQFTIDNLPPGYHDIDLVEFVQALSDVTVLVSVKYVSDRRPKIYPGSSKPYPSANDSGSRKLRTGTGWVREVYKYPNEYSNNKTCECMKCMNSPTPKTQFAHIHIHTATHVVYDGLEAAHTTCHLLFDKGRTPEKCSGVVTLTGMTHMSSDIERDWCEMMFVTHDLDLADKLDKMVKRRLCLYQNISVKYDPIWCEQENRQFSTENARHEQCLTIIVSHPHGCSKQVSLGYCNSKQYVNGIGTYTYNAVTCTGSSGAYVFVLERGADWLWYRHTHAGNCIENRELNFGCLTYYPVS